MIAAPENNNLTKEQAYEAMLEGHKIRNEYYDADEFAFINKDGLIETEDGCVMGTKHDEFWSKYQNFETGWSIIEERQITSVFQDLSQPEPILFTAGPKMDYEDLYRGRPSVELESVRTEPKIQRNSPCPCGCGKKFKNCINK